MSNTTTVTNQPSANIGHIKPIALIQCIKLDHPTSYSRTLPSDYEENIAAHRAPISIASWSRVRDALSRSARKLDGMDIKNEREREREMETEREKAIVPVCPLKSAVG